MKSECRRCGATTSAPALHQAPDGRLCIAPGFTTLDAFGGKTA